MSESSCESLGLLEQDLLETEIEIIRLENMVSLLDNSGEQLKSSMNHYLNMWRETGMKSFILKQRKSAQAWFQCRASSYAIRNRLYDLREERQTLDSELTSRCEQMNNSCLADELADSDSDSDSET